MIYHKRVMDNFFSRETNGPVSSNAFLLYRPESTAREEMVFYNKEAWQILSMTDHSLKKGNASLSKIPMICSKWRNCLEKRNAEPPKPGEKEASEVCFIELMKSGQRLYTVRGSVLTGHQYLEQEHEAMFLFILERVCPDRMNLPLISRQWHLNNREQDMVRLLLEDKGNKEIAQTLGLSIDTVKGYMKLLMRKLGVTSRTGIIASLLTKKR